MALGSCYFLVFLLCNWYLQDNKDEYWAFVLAVSSIAGMTILLGCLNIYLFVDCYNTLVNNLKEACAFLYYYVFIFPVFILGFIGALAGFILGAAIKLSSRVISRLRDGPRNR